MSPDNPSEVERKNFPQEPSLWRWYQNWRYEIIQPLTYLSGFAELLLKDINDTLNKPLTKDDKRKFLEIVLNKSKSLQRSFDLLDLYLRCKEQGYPDLVVWKGESAAKMFEDVFDELRGEKKFAKLILNGMDSIPLVRTSESLVKSVFTILLTYIYNQDKKEWVIEVNFERIDDFYIGVEIDANFQPLYLESLTIDQLFDEPPYHLLMSKFLIESLDGKFEAFFRDKKLIYKILLPIWWLPETVAETIRINLEEQIVELFLGQGFEIVQVLDESKESSISQLQIVECNQEIIANIASSISQKGLHILSFASVKTGVTKLKIQYLPSKNDEPIFCTMQIIVKPQVPNIV
jgi:hypothetical protein